MSVAVLGEALIDFLQSEDGSYRPHLGGSPYNVAIGLARQGVPVSYLSPLSDDQFGDMLHDSLIKSGVRLALDRRSLWPTSLALVAIAANGQPSYRLYREGIADKDTSYEEIVNNLPADLKVFHTGSLAITPSQLTKIRRVFAELRRRKILISIDINIRLRASIDEQKYLDGVQALIAEADIVKASDEDIAAFNLCADPAEAAERLYRTMNGGLFVLTEGSGGAIIFSDNEKIRKRAYPVASLVDTVGAGDTFHSAVIASIFREKGFDGPLPNIPSAVLHESLDYGCAAAAINVSRAGCSPPTHDEVSQFIKAARR